VERNAVLPAAVNGLQVWSVHLKYMTVSAGYVVCTFAKESSLLMWKCQ